MEDEGRDSQGLAPMGAARAPPWGSGTLGLPRGAGTTELGRININSSSHPEGKGNGKSRVGKAKLCLAPVWSGNVTTVHEDGPGTPQGVSP